MGAPEPVFAPPLSSVPSLDFEEFRNSLLDYLKPEDIGRIEAAYHFSANAHQGQFRVSGEPIFDPACRFLGYRGIGVEMVLAHPQG